MDQRETGGCPVMDGVALEGSVRISSADPERKRFGPSQTSPGPTSDALVVSKCKPLPPSRILHQIPPEIMQDAALNQMIAALPTNYNFEVHKTVWQLRKAGVRRVALQLPEGLQQYALLLCDIMVRHGGTTDAVILADVTYGACCIDDYTAVMLGCDYLVHYGHSCLVPVTMTKIPVLYVFVEIGIVHEPLLAVLGNGQFKDKKVALMATVQYIAVLHALCYEHTYRKGPQDPAELFIPQIRPLSPGEVLGCTSPRLPVDCDALVFVADGRFHLEAAMIANPTVPAYRYDPMNKHVLAESYDHQLMLRTRHHMIQLARTAQHFGIILGTLGRQGSPAVLADLEQKLTAAGRHVTVFLMSEVRPERLKQLAHIDAWVQTSCPRLSIDWNYAFGEAMPLLTPYELNVMLGQARPFWTSKECTDCSCEDRDEPPEQTVVKVEDTMVMEEGLYPMDFYATGDAAHKAGPWTPGFHLRPPKPKKHL